MAESGKENLENQKLSADKEARLKIIREKQYEERQRKLEEMMAQAQAAQKFREQKELERRKRFEEMRAKDDIKKQQVVERKKVIDQAEKERAESILKKNQEKNAKIEAKRKNERSNIVFAFGSSTPRMLDPTDITTSSFWGRRRATSTQNITSNCNNTSMSTSAITLTRRQSERDLDSGSKKRAISAGGLDRSTNESNSTIIPAGCASGYVGRRRTDLMPTIPYKDSPFAVTSRKSLNQSPGRAYSMSRLDQLSKPRKRLTDILPAVVESTSSIYTSLRPLSLPRQSSITRSMSHLAVVSNKTGNPQIRRQLNKSDSRSMHQLNFDGPLIAPRTTRATQLRQQKLYASSNCSEASSRPSSALSQQSTTSVTSAASVRHRPHTVRHPRPVSIAVTGVSDKKDNLRTIPPLPKKLPSTARKSTKKIVNEKSVDNVEPVQQPPTSQHLQQQQQQQQPQPQPQQQPQQQQPQPQQTQQPPPPPTTTTTTPSVTVMNNDNKIDTPAEDSVNKEEVVKKNEMTEEEAKAALAEKRRLAREEAERKAEEERLRLEAERQAELERQRKEEEQMQLLIEQQRQAEQERLEEAIREAQKKEEEERQRKEEERRLKLLKEEAERKAREEAEKQKNELQERLKNEEKEREMRRKRVEAIMLRTRGKNSTNNSMTQSTDDKNENKSEINGTKPEENGTKNGKVEIVDNIIADNSVKNANIDTINSDSLNSNNPWQATQTTLDPLMRT